MNSNELQTIDDLHAYVKRRIYEMHVNDKSLFAEADLKMFAVDEIIDGFARKHNNDTEKIVENLRNCLIWLKEKNYCNIKPSSFPLEYYEAGECLFEHGSDLDGNVVVYMRCKNAMVSREMRECGERIMAFIYCGAIRKGLMRKKGFSVVFDCTSISLENVSVSMGLLTLKLITKMAPDSLRRMLVYNTPYFAKQAMKVVLYAIPPQLRNSIQYVDKHSITDYIAHESLPCFILNPHAQWVPTPPKEAKNFDECDIQVIGMREEDRNKVKRLFYNLKNKNKEF